MSTSKLAWFRTPLMLAFLATTLGLVVISSDTVALTQDGKSGAAVEESGLVEESDSDDVESVNSTGNCFAVISASGVRLRTNCVVSARKILNPGHYEVIYNGNVSTCTFLCSLGNIGTGVPTAGQCVTATRAGNPNGVFIQTQDSAGNRANRDFHTAVFCR